MRITANSLDNVFRAKACSIETMELKGYELIEELFADSSGFGQDSEPALSVNQFERRIGQLVNEHGTLTAKITNHGMFQVYVGLFKKTCKSKAKTIASNVLLVEKEDGKRAIRLYETDIVTDNGDGTLTVDNGGYSTMTTHKRINEFSSLHASRKNWETYVNGINLNEQQVFEGSLTV